MKNLIVCALALAFQATYAAERSVEVLVVAEQTDPSVASIRPTTTQPVTCVAVAGGYIEAGISVAGGKAPDAAKLDQALSAALTAQNYQPNAKSATPSLLLIYHWGSIRPSDYRQSGSWEIDPNFKARLELISTSRQAGMIENHLLRERFGAKINPNYPSPALLDFDQKEMIGRARDGRYFVIVSAYDYPAINQREAKLVWRTKVSVRENSINLNSVLPTLITSSASYWGTHESETRTISVALDPYPPVASDVAGELVTVEQTHDAFVQELIQREHKEFAGERIDAPAEKRNSGTASQSVAPSAATDSEAFAEPRSGRSI